MPQSEISNFTFVSSNENIPALHSRPYCLKQLLTTLQGVVGFGRWLIAAKSMCDSTSPPPLPTTGCPPRSSIPPWQAQITMKQLQILLSFKDQCKGAAKPCTHTIFVMQLADFKGSLVSSVCHRIWFWHSSTISPPPSTHTHAASHAPSPVHQTRTAFHHRHLPAPSLPSTQGVGPGIVGGIDDGVHCLVLGDLVKGPPLLLGCQHAHLEDVESEACVLFPRAYL